MVPGLVRLSPSSGTKERDKKNCVGGGGCSEDTQSFRLRRIRLTEFGERIGRGRRVRGGDGGKREEVGGREGDLVFVPKVQLSLPLSSLRVVLGSNRGP